MLKGDGHGFFWRYRFAAALLVAFALGLLSFPVLRAAKNMALQAIQGSPLHDAVQPQFEARPYVVMVLGQSNAANHAGPLTVAPGHFSFEGGLFFPLADPLRGCTGDAGSPWPSFAQSMQGHLGGRPVVVACLAISGSAVAEWSPQGPYFARVRTAVAQLSEAGLVVDAIVWHQGETDSVLGTSFTDYRNALTGVAQALHALTPAARIYVCQTSLGTSGGSLSTAVRSAQQAVIDELPYVSAGADTDTLGPALRRDGVHFTLRGVEQFAQLLAQAMLKPQDKAVTLGAP